MANHDVRLDTIEITSPCSVPWSSMTGDDVRRFCGQCRLHVYDLSQLTGDEIQELYTKTGGEFCKRIWRRPDGRIITRDCRRFVPAMRRRLGALATAAVGALALVGFLGCGSRSSSTSDESAEPPSTVPSAPNIEEKPEPDATECIGR